MSSGPPVTDPAGSGPAGSGPPADEPGNGPADRPAGGLVPLSTVAGPARPPRPLGPGTLARSLVLRMVGLVAAVALAIGLLTPLAVQQLLVRQLDGQLFTSLIRQQHAGPPSGAGGRPPGILVLGQPEGLLIVQYEGDTATAAVIAPYGRTLDVVPAVVDKLARLAPGQARTESLEGLGRYRVVSQQRGDVTVVVGLPTTAMDRLLLRLAVAELVLLLVATGLAAIVGRALVLRSLRPLNRLAGAAREVSGLQLDRGDVRLDVRVPPGDTDPRSEVGQVGSAFNRMIDNVATAFAARQRSETKLRQFAADASHELRNPLASISGYAQLTRRERAALPSDVAFALGRIESESERMASLVEDLLLLARLDAGPALVTAQVDLTEVVVNAVSDARAAGGDHVWRMAVPAEPVTCHGDPRRLHEVAVNLLANARTHTPPGTTVETRLRRDGDHVELTVTDDGPGIPEQIQDRVFERFTRADASRARAANGGPSTGLGLAIVAAVVGAHHGTVSVDSAPGRTTFTVRIPAGEPDRTPRRAAAPRRPGD